MNRLLLFGLIALAANACGRATKEQEKEASGAQSSERGKILYYRNPMGGPDTSPVPKKDSMGMDYIAVYENETEAAGAAVVVPSETIQTLGVRIEAAKIVDFGRTIRAFGVVADNTRLVSEATARVGGWVDELGVTAVGDAVKKGDFLYRLRSPDLIAAERDYVSALKSGSPSWAASAAKRLKNLGLQDRTIADIKRSGAVQDLTPFYAERDGVVSVLNVRKGAFVEAGDQVATIADYGEVWVIASISEQDLPLVGAGASATVTLPNAADVAATVDYVYPTVDPKTRTGRARIILDNKDLTLRAGAYVDVSFETERRSRLAVPSPAILRDAGGAHVVMAMGEGRFMPTPVKTGLVSEGYTEILDGLEAGVAIVVSGQFLIDSESNLRESLGKLAPHADHASTGAATDAESHKREDGGGP